MWAIRTITYRQGQQPAPYHDYICGRAFFIVCGQLHNQIEPISLALEIVVDENWTNLQAGIEVPFGR